MLIEPQDQFNHSAAALENPPEFDSAHFDMFAKTKSNGFVDEIVFIHKGSGVQYPVRRDVISAAFGEPMMTTFERIFGHDGSRLSIPQRPKAVHPDDKRDILQPIHQMSFRAKDDTTWKIVKTQDIIDRIIQYSIEEELRMQDELEKVLLAQIEEKPLPDNVLSLSEDDIILSTGESFADFSARIGDDDVRIEVVEDATDSEIRDGLAQAEQNRLDIEARAKAKPHDARGLQKSLQEFFPKITKPDADGLLNRLLSTTSGAAQNVLECARSLSPKQARLVEAAALTATILTTQFSQTSNIEIQPDAVTVTSLADVNVQTETSQPENQAQEENQQCLQSITPEQMIDARVALFEQSQFYQDRINSPTYSERARVIWVRIVADAVKEVWARDADHFMRNGYRDMNHLFMTELYKAYAESHGNQFKYSRSNPLVAGLYHVSVKTANSIVDQQNLRDKYPGVFPNRALRKSDLINARISTILDTYISAADYRYLSNRFDAEVGDVFSKYHPYIPHVNGGPVAFDLINAAINHPTRLDRRTGQRVLKTAVDIVGRGVANDNPSLYYRTVKIYRGNEVTTAFIKTLPEDAVKKVRTRRVARSVDESIGILNERGQNQAGIETIGHTSQQAVNAAACRIAA